MNVDAMRRAAQQNVYAAFAARFPTDGGAVFIDGFDGAGITYREVAVTTARFAQALRAAGVAPGDRIAGVLEKSPAAMLLYLASCRIGAVYVPVHIELTLPEIAYILADAEPAVVVCRPDLADRLAAPGRAVLTLDAAGGGSLIAASAELPPDAPVAAGDADAPNAIVYTSGTTGRPKGAVMTNGLVIWNALALAERWQITGDDVLLHANPLAFGLFGTTTPILAAGARLRLLRKFHADDVIAALPEVTMFSGVPTYYARLVAHPGFTAATCRRIRLFITGSAPMRADLFDAVARTGHVLLDRYGLTEALIATSMPAAGVRRPDRSGRPLAGATLRVVDETGAEVPAGTVGSIELHQPFFFGGYWKAPEKTRAAFTGDGWFITGDFGSVDSDGDLCVLGRGTDLIITGGFNVYPKEVELGLNALPNVAESAVIGVPHPDFGEAVVAVLQLVDPIVGFSAAAAQAALAQGLARYKLPKHIEIVAELPRNTLGKIQKKLLKEQLADRFVSPGRS